MSPKSKQFQSYNVTAPNSDFCPAGVHDREARIEGTFKGLPVRTVSFVQEQRPHAEITLTPDAVMSDSLRYVCEGRNPGTD